MNIIEVHASKMLDMNIIIMTISGYADVQMEDVALRRAGELHCGDYNGGTGPKSTTERAYFPLTLGSTCNL